MKFNAQSMQRGAEEFAAHGCLHKSFGCHCTTGERELYMDQRFTKGVCDVRKRGRWVAFVMCHLVIVYAVLSPFVLQVDRDAYDLLLERDVCARREWAKAHVCGGLETAKCLVGHVLAHGSC